MSASISIKKKSIGVDFLKRTAGIISSASTDYVSDALPVTTQTLSEAKNTISSVSSTFSNTTQSVMPKLRQIKSQVSIKNILNWYMDKEDDFGFGGNDDNMSFDIDVDDISADIAEAQITEFDRGANQVSQTVVESTHQAVEAHLAATANLVTTMQNQTAVISAGFDKTNETLNKILEVVTKNTATLIETNIANSKKDSTNDMMMSGKFNASSYKQIVSNNLKNSQFGMAATMLSGFANPTMVKQMFTPETIASMLGGALMDKKHPNFKKNLKAIDDVVNDAIMTSIIRLGQSNQYSNAGSIAKLFGIDTSRKNASTSRSSLEFKSVPFDSITRESITNAIPGYLRKILVALGGEDTVYDYRSRSFKSKAAVHREFRNAAVTTGSLNTADRRIAQAMGSDKFGSMIYDLMMNDLGSKMGNNNARNIVSKFNNTSDAKDYIINTLLEGIQLDSKERKRIDQIAGNLGKAYKNGAGIKIIDSAAKHNIQRNAKMKEYVDKANMYEVDLSEFRDSIMEDQKTILRAYGIGTDPKSHSTVKMKSETYSGSDYTNIALYEIYRKLNKGINVFQVGSDNSRSKPFANYTGKLLQKPLRYKDQSMVDESSPMKRSSLAGDTRYDDTNLLENQVLEDGSVENLTKGQRFKRWGKDRGGTLLNAIFNGSPEQVRDAFGLMIGDITKTTGHAIKSKISDINKGNGNITGYLKHKITGASYSYIGDDGKEYTVDKNEKGGVLGYFDDVIFGPGGHKAAMKKVSSMGSKWFKGVSKYFKYDDGDNKEKGIAGKRNNIIGTSVGAMLGMGLLGGPLGLLMGGVAGSAISQTSGIGSKINKLLFGDKDHEGDKKKDRDKRRGLIGRAVDQIVDPIKFQIGKTMTKFGSTIQKNILGPLSNIGYAIRDRMSNAAGGVVSKVFGKVFGGMTGVLKKLIMAPINIAKAPITIAGKLARGTADVGGGFIGGGLNSIAKLIGGKHAKDELNQRIKGQKHDADIFEAESGYYGDYDFDYEQDPNGPTGKMRKTAKKKSKWYKSSYSTWKSKQDEARDKVKDISEYTEENVHLTSEIADDVHAMADEALTKGSLYTHDEGLHTRLDDIIDIIKGMKSDDGIGTKNKHINANDNTFGNTLLQAASTISDEGGIDDADIKTIEDISTGIQRNNSKASLFGKFKGLLKRNKDKADENTNTESKEKESIFSTIKETASDLIGKVAPFVLGALALSNDEIRNIATDLLSKAGSWLTSNLPSILKGVLNIGGTLAKGANEAIENAATGASSVTDPVTKETKSVVSAETHAEKVKDGVLSSAISSGSNLFARAKDNLIMAGERGVIRGGAKLVTAGGSVISGMAGATNLGTKVVQSVGSFAQGVAQNGFNKVGLSKGLEFAGRTFTLGGSKLAAGTASAASSVASGAKSVSGFFGTFKNTLKPSNLFNKGNIASNVGNIANLVGGAASNLVASIGWDATETAKHSNILGDYGLGNAGGYVQTSNTAKTVTTTSIGMAGGIAIGAACKTAAAALATTGAINGWNPVGWAALVVAGVLAISAALAALTNWIVGLATDGANKDYAIRSNASKLGKIINDGEIDYTKGSDNPMYVYCAQESDRAIGLTDGLFIKDPEYVFGKYLKTIADGSASSPGAIVLLYDWINNMAVQGVPFACIKAGDSEEAKITSNHANSTSTNGPDITRTGPMGGEYCQVYKSDVKKNKEKVFADIWTNIERQDSSCTWSYQSLDEVWDECEPVIRKLKNKGILNDKGKVETSKFKGKPGASKNAEGWAALHDICESKGLYFLTKCLVYINSKIEADKNGKQWLELHQDDLVTLMEGLKDTISKEANSTIEEMKESGMSDSEISEALANSVNPNAKGEKAQGAAALSEADSTYSSISKVGIRDKDRADVAKELKLITASYAYAHPTILQEWVSKHTTSETGVSKDDVEKISNWKTAFPGDKRQKQILRGEMATAARKFAETQGDIFGLTSLFNWKENGSIYTGNSKDPGEKYGSGFVFRGKKKGPGKGKLDSIWNNSSKPIEQSTTPDQMHNELFGKDEHGKASESSSVSGMDMTKAGSGIIADIADFATKYPSDELKSQLGDKIGEWKNVLAAIPSSNPKNLAVGGPELDDEEMEEGVTSTISESEGGNPLNKDFKITSQYGYRTYPHSGMHNGVDLVPTTSDGTATEVGSRFNGTIIGVKANVSDSDTAQKVGSSWQYNGNNSTGNMVTIQTDDGMVIKNMHLKAGSIPSNIKEGTRISVGDKIGEMGSTGWSTGPHLHYQIEDGNGNTVDPTAYINGSTISSFATSSDSTYPSAEYNTSTVSSTSSDTGNSKLSSILSTLSDIGNRFLYAITGGLIGSNSSDSDVSTSTTTTSYGSTPVLVTTSNSKWVNIVRKVKAAVAKNKPKYNQSGSTRINVDGTELNVRTDCTGIIAAMLKLYGAISMNDNITSNSLLNDGAIKSGFVKAAWPGWDKLVEGDIMSRSGHAEIFAKNEGNIHYVYNGGNTSALQNEGPTTCSKTSYSVIWRCQETASTIGSTETIGSSGTAGTYASTSESDIWNYLTKLGYTDVAKAGIMGTWAEETHNDVNTLEGYYLPGFPGVDKVLASNKALNDYTTGVLFPAYAKSKINYKEHEYIAQDGNYYPGFGIAQWTGPRGLNLINHAKSIGKDWRNVDGQMEFFNKEMKDNVRGITPDVINAETRVDDATRLFANKYEGTHYTPWISARQTQANRIYNAFANQNPTDGVGGGDEASISTSRFGRRAASVGRKVQDSVANIGSRVSTTFKSAFSNQDNDRVDTGSSSNSLDHVQELLSAVIAELKIISGNTGTSNNLLNTLNQKDFVDSELRNSLSQRSNTSKTKSTTQYRAGSGTNARAIAALARP